MMKRVFRRWTTRQISLLKSNTTLDANDAAHYENNTQQQEYQEAKSIAGYTLKTEEQFDLEIPIPAIGQNTNKNNSNAVANNSNTNKTNLLKLKLIPHVIIPSESKEANDSNVSSVTWDSDVKYRHRRRKKKSVHQLYRPPTPLRLDQGDDDDDDDDEQLQDQQQQFPVKSIFPSSLCQSSWSSACCAIGSVEPTVLEAISEDDRSLTTSKNNKTITPTTAKSRFMSCGRFGLTRNACWTASKSNDPATQTMTSPTRNKHNGCFQNPWSCGGTTGQRRQQQQQLHQEGKLFSGLRSRQEQSRAFLGSDSRTHGTGYYATARSMDKSLFDEITMVESSADDNNDDGLIMTQTSSQNYRQAMTEDIPTQYSQKEQIQTLKLLRPPGKQFRRRLRMQSKHNPATEC